MGTIIIGADGKPRCRWCSTVPELLEYHDTEWGFPVGNDNRLFEKLSLEGFQSGLSWRTVLAKRENFRKAFRGFDYHQITRFTQKDIEDLLTDRGIIRHRGKIEAVVNNAKRATELAGREGSLAAYIWRHEPDRMRLAVPQTVSSSPESAALSRDLKKLGWKFVGPTTVFAFMQSMGLINDHVEGCAIRAKVEQARERFQRPEN